MKKEKNKIKHNKNNKNFWKWAIYSLFLIFFASSAIMNISYLPKYFSLKNNQNQGNQILNLDIAAYDENDIELISFHYQTILTTLGNIMKQHSSIYILTAYPFGAFLTGIRYLDQNGEMQEKKATAPSWWEIYYNGKAAQIGIDDLFLRPNDNISLYFRT